MKTPKKEIIFSGRDMRAVMTCRKNRITLDGREFFEERLIFKADDRESLIVNGRRYHGCLEVIRKGSSVTLVNYVELEDYIKGIAVREISHYWPADVLRAHAVVFRTYALYAMKQNRAKDFDVTSDVYSQVYGGSSAQRYRITDAVDETRGDVLTFNGRVFPAYFHSTCGGRTEDASVLWDIDIPPLKGVDCFYCNKSPHYSWNSAFSAVKMISKLRKSGIGLPGSFLGIEGNGRDASGRLTELVVNMSGGTVRVKAKDFRNILGPDIVRSANFTVTRRGENISLKGYGWGHGAGMCQWGAYFMSKSGNTFTEILSFYYPGASIINIRELGY